jgi:hypothetical protein
MMHSPDEPIRTFKILRRSRRLAISRERYATPGWQMDASVSHI